jgi:hypothetical protein
MFSALLLHECGEQREIDGGWQETVRNLGDQWA